MDFLHIERHSKFDQFVLLSRSEESEEVVAYQKDEIWQRVETSAKR